MTHISKLTNYPTVFGFV